jgi:hypothetical protein
VFSSHAEFLAHHRPCSIEAANEYLNHDRIQEMLIREWSNFQRHGSIQLKQRKVANINDYKKR